MAASKTFTEEQFNNAVRDILERYSEFEDEKGKSDPVVGMLLAMMFAMLHSKIFKEDETKEGNNDGE